MLTPEQMRFTMFRHREMGGNWRVISQPPDSFGVWLKDRGTGTEYNVGVQSLLRAFEPFDSLLQAFPSDLEPVSERDEMRALAQRQVEARGGVG